MTTSINSTKTMDGKSDKISCIKKKNNENMNDRQTIKILNAHRTKESSLKISAVYLI